MSWAGLEPQALGVASSDGDRYTTPLPQTLDSLFHTHSSSYIFEFNIYQLIATTQKCAKLFLAKLGTLNDFYP